MTNNIYIIGAGGFGKEVKSALKGSDFVFSGFIDDDKTKSLVICGIDSVSEIKNSSSSNFQIAIGSSSTRKLIFERLPQNLSFPTICHPTAIFQDEESIAVKQGCFIGAGTILTCDISIGPFALINLNCTIGHDVTMGNFCSLMPSVNLSGNVTLQDEVFIGTGATVLQGVTIGRGAIVGAGAVVTRNVEPGQTVVGIPAQPVKT